ncbi:MAG: hypothetical protein B7X59_08455 [Polaromonas sp. 39-63-203]|nr:MAG: hypothetical protein B7X59_08455 [Polaromonas sp. 39-63-203]
MSSGELGRSGVSAVKWSALSTGSRFVLQLVAQVILARTLGPEAYGVFAIGMVVLTFANFVSGFGFSWSLLQRPTVNDEDIRFAWTWQIIVGLVTMVALYFMAPWLATYFREPRAQSVIQWLSLACLLGAAASPATYLLQRDLDFRKVGLIQVGSYAAGYVAVGVPMALLGFGTASLVAAWLVQCGVVFVASYAAKPHAVRPLFWYPDARTAVSTGRAVFLTNVVNWILNNLDRVLIARLLNAYALGLYNVAYNLATQPNALLLGALQPAFLAAKNYEFALQLPIIVLGLLGFYFFAALGIRVAAAVAAAMLVARAVVIAGAAFRALKLSPTVLWPDALRSMLLAAVCSISVVTGQEAVARFDMPILSLAASTLATLLVLALLLLLRPHLLGEQTNGMIVRFVPALAGRLGKAAVAPYPDSVSEQRL